MMQLLLFIGFFAGGEAGFHRNLSATVPGHAYAWLPASRLRLKDVLSIHLLTPFSHGTAQDGIH
jgi:hypothetical protein